MSKSVAIGTVLGFIAGAAVATAVIVGLAFAFGSDSPITESAPATKSAQDRQADYLDSLTGTSFGDNETSVNLALGKGVCNGLRAGRTKDAQISTLAERHPGDAERLVNSAIENLCPEMG